MKQVNGYVSFVLHAHLPFVHHPESEDYLEEQWLATLRQKHTITVHYDVLNKLK